MITESNKRKTSLDKQKQPPYTPSFKKDVLINSATESAFAVVAPHAILSAVTAQRRRLEWIMVFILP
jgi:hypothetical protein